MIIEPNKPLCLNASQRNLISCAITHALHHDEITCASEVHADMRAFQKALDKGAFSQKDIRVITARECIAVHKSLESWREAIHEAIMATVNLRADAHDIQVDIKKAREDAN